MGLKFNPLTAQFDLTGSGGGASYIDGEVATYNDLPLSNTTAPLNTAWLVRGSSGVWPFTKPGGIYVRTATGGTSRDADYTYGGIFPDVFSDANFTLYDDSDTSKNAKFQLSGISTGTTRTLTVPDGSGTIQLALVRSSSSMSGNVSLSAGRARHITYTLLGGSYQVTLPLTGNQSGDVCRFTNSTSSSSGAILTVARGNGSGGVVIITTLERNQTVTCFNRDGTETGWTLEGVDTHTHAAADVTSGVFDNARINFAAPSAIGSTTASSGAFTTLNANNGTLTASATALAVSQTWNATGVVFNTVDINNTITAANANSTYIRCASSGNSQFEVRNGGAAVGTSFIGSNGFRAIGGGNGGGQVILTSNGYYCWNDATTNTFATQDLFLRRDAAGILAQHNLANPQAYRIYNTTDAGLTNFERGFMRWSSNNFEIGSEAAGTGSNRAVIIRTGSVQYNFSTIGTLTIPGNLHVNSTNYMGLSNRSRFSSASDGVMLISNWLATDFGRLQFGGTDNTFPALKRSSTALQVRLADDSADAPFSSGAITTSGTVTANNTTSGFVTSSAPNGASPIRFAANSGDVLIQSANAAGIVEFRGTTGTNPQSLRVFNTFTSGTSFERLNIRWASNECIIDAEAGSGGGTLRGIKIGSATSSLLGFYGVTPVDQPATVADPAGGGTVDTESRTAINAIIDRLQELGLIA